MTRLNTYWGKTTDLLSALLLLLSILLAGGYGPLTAQATAVPPASQSDAGTGGHRSAPVITKQQLLAGETRDTKAAPWDDGKPKAFLVSASLELPAPIAGAGHAAQSFALALSIAASPYEARAPPAIS